MKIIEVILDILNRFVKKDDPIEEPEVKESVEDVDPKLTVSDKEPTGGEDRDVWLKYEGGE